MKCILVLLLSVSFNYLFSQHLGVFEDERQRFYVFDKDHFTKLEFLPIREYWIGKNYVAYINSKGRFMMYFEGEKHEVTLSKVDVRSSDNFLVYFIDEQLWLFDGNQIKVVERWTKSVDLETTKTFPSFVISDSIIGFTNSYDRFVVYDNKVNEVEQWDIKKAKAGINTVAYIDYNDMFKIWNKDFHEIIEDEKPRSFSVAKDIVAYKDDFNSLKFWYNNEVFDAQDIAPKRYYLADEMLAFVTDLDEFVCYYKGEKIELLQHKPKKALAKDNVLVYIDIRNNTYAFINGKSTLISKYVPFNIKIEDDLVYFKDLDGYLYMFKNDSVQKITNEITQSHKTFNDVVIYKPNDFTWKAIYKGAVFEFIPEF